MNTLSGLSAAIAELVAAVSSKQITNFKNRKRPSGEFIRRLLVRKQHQRPLLAIVHRLGDGDRFLRDRV
jgi:hypothetical protein